MRLLLDTCTFLWASTDRRRLSSFATDLIEDPAHELFLSAASAFEIATKVKLGRLRMTDPPEVEVPRSRLELGASELPVSEAAALYSFNLPLIHRDPFDRMLISQAIVEGLALVTSDAIIRKYEVRVFW